MLPTRETIENMLKSFEMAYELRDGGIYVYSTIDQKEYGTFSGTGAFLDHWLAQAAMVINENRKISIVGERYSAADEDVRDEIKDAVIAYFGGDEKALRPYFVEMVALTAETLPDDWVSEFARIRADPKSASHLDDGIIYALLKVDPGLANWAHRMSNHFFKL